jgi:DNA-binding MarR family transcriptional regulator
MNKLVHEQSRLKLLTMLASSTVPVPFTQIRDGLSMTAGNLSVQLKTLEDAGYIRTEKYFADNKPRTDVSITGEGEKALMEYLDELEELVSALRLLKGADRK